MSRLLLEVGTEAVPAGYMPPALAALEERARAGLSELRLAAGTVRVLGTPKRLVLEVEGIAARQEDLTREVFGPRAEAAFKDGKPTPAAEGFARKTGVLVADLDRVVTEKGELLRARVHESGRPASEVLPAFLERLVSELPWPKTMVWTEARFRFPRPIRWIVCLLDDSVLPVSLAGLRSGKTTRGHRLLGPGSREVARADRLLSVLMDAGVVLDPAERRRRIEAGLDAQARKIGGKAILDEGLLDEVVFLTEHPGVLSGSFDPEFLALPAEVVVTAMRSHQRYFAVQDDTGALLPRFLVVTDGAWPDPSRVIAGNERVLRARLSDARFYWDTDRKTGLERLAGSLETIVWLEPIGSLRDKSDRLERLVERLGEAWFPSEWPAHKNAAIRAARLSKADLASEMIKDGKEFTGLQGAMGARYAEAAGEPPGVVRGIAEQYLPRGARDPLPESVEGTLLAVADRLDTLAGCWAAGFKPSGSADPYGLRRAANGIVRIALERRRSVSIGSLVGEAVSLLPEAARKEGLAAEILEFLRDRIAWFLREEGITYDVVDAVLAAGADDPIDSRARASALNALRGEPDLERLVIGFKRAANILKGIPASDLPDPAAIDWSKAHPAEQALHQAVLSVGKGLDAARERRDYPAMIRLLLELRAPIDQFFDDVMVMSKDAGERGRRLALLDEARSLFHDFFDPSRIVIEGEAGA